MAARSRSESLALDTLNEILSRIDINYDPTDDQITKAVAYLKIVIDDEREVGYFRGLDEGRAGY